MSRFDTSRAGPHFAAQTAASWAALDSAARGEALAAALTKQDQAFWEALGELQAVCEFVGLPEHILGSANTKHGEIAEHVHVGVRRAFDLLHQRTPSTSFEGVPRLDRADYLDGGQEIQSKFHDGLRNTLEGVRSHAEQYEDFVSSGGRYHIPKDQAEQLRQCLESGTMDGLANRSVERIQQVVENLQRTTGRPVEDLVGPSESRYDEVQQAQIHETIKDREDRLTDKNEELKDKAHGEHDPSLTGAATAAAIGAAAGGGVRLAQAVWVKYRDGKNLFQGDFSAEDWKDIELDTAQGAGTGAVAGATLYLLTNSTDLAAPFAGTLVSSMMGIGDLLGYYHAGEIDGEQFVDSSFEVAAEAAIVGLSAAAGQTLIPIPMLGAFVGSIAGKIVALAIRDGIGEAELELVERLRAYEAEAIGKLDDALRAAMDELDAYFGRLSDLALIAFDETVNTELRLVASIQIAEAVEVPSHQILRSNADLDTFMEQVDMDLLHGTLEGFSPELYVATLSRVAHSDGIHPDEQEMLEQHASRFGVDLNSLPDLPEDLSDLPWATRILIYRDAYMMALADGSFSPEEEERLVELAGSLKLSREKVDSIQVWVRDYGELLERFDGLLKIAGGR